MRRDWCRKRSISSPPSKALTAACWIGALVATIVPVAFGLNTVILRKMGATVDMIPAILIAGVISAMVTLPLALPFEAVGRDFALLATMGVMQVGLGCIMMTIASRHLAAAETLAQTVTSARNVQREQVAVFKQALTDGDKAAALAARDAMWEVLYPTFQQFYDLAQAWNEFTYRTADDEF